MTASRKQSSENTAAPGAQGDEALRARRAEEDAQMFQGATDRNEAWTRNERTHEPEDAPPTVGKTSGRGAKAERPSPVSDRKEASKAPVEVTRGAKPPAETPRAPAYKGKPRARG